MAGDVAHRCSVVQVPDPNRSEVVNDWAAYDASCSAVTVIGGSGLDGDDSSGSVASSPCRSLIVVWWSSKEAVAFST